MVVNVSVDRASLECIVKVGEVEVFRNVIYEWTVSDMFKVLDNLGTKWTYEEI